MTRMTKRGSAVLEGLIKERLTNGPISIASLNLEFYPGPKNRFSVFLRSRFAVSEDGMVSLGSPNLSTRAQENQDKKTVIKMGKALDRMSRRIEELEQALEVMTRRLREAGRLPTISQRARDALARFGD